MSLKSWTPSIENRDTSSGGQFLKGLGELWSQETSSGPEGSENYRVRFRVTVDHLETTRSWEITGTDYFALMRVLCSGLIARMPEEGLEECYREIDGIHRFYSVQPKKFLPPSTTERVVANLSSGSRSTQ